VLFSRNLNSKLNQEIEEEVSAFTARASRQPTDDEFLVLENTIRELRAKYVKNGGNRGVSAAGSRGSSDGGRRGSAASRCSGTRSSSQRGVSERESGVQVEETGAPMEDIVKTACSKQMSLAKTLSGYKHR